MSYACIGISTADGQVLTTHYQSEEMKMAITAAQVKELREMTLLV